MGFSTLLQGRSSHEALIALQDAELRLLENMRRCLSLRVKCDREYAIALNTVCMQAQRSGDQLGNEIAGSLVAKAWKTVIEETEGLSRLVKQNADHLACVTIEKISFLISEKRFSRKIYLEEHNRIESELLQFQDAVLKAKHDYEKCLETFRTTKARYEEQAVKGRGTKKLEEARDKHLKACGKLHRIHNDYVLLLCEAAEYEKSFRTMLLPSLLEFQQSLQEEMVEQWKTILADFVQRTDMTSEKFQDIQANIADSIQDILPSSEYKDFMERYKSPPPFPIAFIFDRKLIDDYNGRLKPNVLIVDDLTFTLLKLKLIEIDDRLKECQAALKEKQTQLGQYENEVAVLRKTAEMAATIFVKRKMVETLRRDMSELKMKELKYLKQKDLIIGPLSQIGEEGPPLAIDYLDEFFNGEEITMTGTLNRQQSLNLVEKLRKPFLKRQVNSQQSAFFDKYFGDRNTAVSSPNIRQTEFQLNVNPEMPLHEEEWFHGVLPREEVVRLLVNDGDYLVRETTRNQERQIVLSVRWHGHKHFIIQHTPDNKYRFEGLSFPSIQELMLYQHNSGLPVTNKSATVLLKPILRERWELSNSDVELLTKIGRGNFGDVYRARLRSSGFEVAVKTCHITLPDEQKKKFLQEGRILKQYDHPNIVKLIGICVQKQPIMIVMELVPGGSLLNFLRTQGSYLTLLEKMQMCVECGAGMEYLESKNCIHRDLAARNCLIGKDNIVKISDFGMSREEEEYIVSDGMKQIPIKWTAPEALNFGKYTSLCDVWSFGVLLWEIFSNGSTPYSGLSNSKAREMIDSGYRMPAPEGTPTQVYQLMLKCWEYNADLRPSFCYLHDALYNIQDSLACDERM